MAYHDRIADHQLVKTSLATSRRAFGVAIARAWQAAGRTTR
jgi:hypothetical protein